MDRDNRAYRRGAALTGALLATIVLGASQPAVTRPSPARAVPVGGAPARAGLRAADSFRSDTSYPAVADPVRVRIPDLRMDGPVQRLGRAPDGAVEVPRRTDVAGWYERGPRPGQPGPAVILGHVDSRDGPGIFARLAAIRPGTRVHVDRADGSTVTFQVTGLARVPKTAFPTDLVYGATLDPTLRLVTCGGTFDRTRESYRDNVIAYAEPV